jgi:hypothetical protein
MKAPWWTMAVCTALAWTSPAHAQLSDLTGALEQAKTAPKEGAQGGAPAEGSAAEAAAAAAEAEAEAEAATPWVSQFCALSFFTQESDTLDLRSSPGDPCFDTGRGADVFRLDPENFPEGVRVFSDRGRSVLRLSDGPSLVFDQESTAEEIRTGRGDDTIRLGVGFVGASNPVVTPETRVFPGGGNDLIVIGSGLGPAIDARHVANARVFPDGGTLALEAGCGRPKDPDSIDAIVENADASVQVSAVVRGCGLALRNHAAPAVVDQVGGRFVALLRPEGEEGVPGAFFDASVQESSGLNFSALNPRGDTVLDWSGYGDATLQVEARLPSSGGTYTVAADGAVFARVLAHGGNPAWDLVSTRGVELVVEGVGTQRVRASLAAPVVSIEWRPEGEAAPPTIETRSGVEAKAIRQDSTSPLSESVASVQMVPGTDEAVAEGEAAPQADESNEEGASKDEEPKEGEAAEAAVEVPVQSVARDSDGMTPAGRQAMLEGRPVEMDVTGSARNWEWDTVPVVVDTQTVAWRIVADKAWCETIGPVGGEAMPCADGAVFRLEPGQAFTTTRTDGTRVWTLSTSHAVEVRWLPDR